MNFRIRYILPISCACLIFGSMSLYAFSQEIPMSVQALEGTVEVWQTGNPNWAALEDNIIVHTGDQVRTADGGQAALWLAEWGGILLKSETHITLTSLSPPNVDGIACAIHQGEIDIELRDMPEDIALEIRHSIGILSSRSAGGFATFKLSGPMPEIIVQEGEFLIQQVENADLMIFGFVDNAKEGIAFVQQSQDSSLLLSVEREEQSIRLQSAFPLPALRAMIGLTGDILTVHNIGETLSVNFQGNTATLDADDMATFLIPSDQELLLTTPGTSHFQLWFRRSSFFTIADQGTIKVNGQEIYPGDCGYFLIKEPEETVFFEERGETPIVPPAPQAPDVPPPASPNRPIGSPILP